MRFRDGDSDGVGRINNNPKTAIPASAEKTPYKMTEELNGADETGAVLKKKKRT